MNAENMQDFSEAWCWLLDHPALNHEEYNSLEDNLTIAVVFVNPSTECIDEDNSLNTAIRIWLETGPPECLEPDKNDMNGWRWTHDENLNCGGPTFEDAIIELADLVQHHYGDYDNIDSVEESVE